MGLKHYIAGIATVLAVCGALYWKSQQDKIARERCIDLVEYTQPVSTKKVRVIKEDKKWSLKHTYRIEALDERGVVKMRFEGLTKEPTLEKIADNNDL